ncbi:MAG: LysR family transcriptional regulator [Rhizobiales bacterium]|nr:LysR family transcriptional regulator [Rhizobacter sp.]
MGLFVKVVEHGSFSKAAAQLGMPISTLSRKVAELEASLGVRLLERSTRKLRLTEMGSGYFDRCQRALLELDAADAAITGGQRQLTGRIRISVPPSMSDLIVMPLVSSFQALHPEVVFQILVTDRYIDHIGDGVDLSLRVGDSNDSSLVASTVAVHRPRLVAAPRYMASISALSHPPDLLQHVHIAFARWERPVQWVLHHQAESVLLSPKPAILINDYAGVLYGVLAGAGISELPSFICGAALADGRLIEPLPQWAFSSFNVAASYPSNKHLSPIVRAFKSHCVGHFEKHPMSALPSRDC